MIANDSVSQQSLSFTKHPHILGATATFYTDWLDTIWDEWEATRVDVDAVDCHSNPSTMLAYHRASMWGQLAYALTGSDDIYGDSVALSFGMLSGYWSALMQYPDLADQIKQDPVGTIGTLGVFTAAFRDPTIMSILIASLPSSIDQIMAAENPYDEYSQPGLYGWFESGWYSGYIVMTLCTLYLGAEAFAAISSSTALSSAVASISARFGSSMPYLCLIIMMCVPGEISLGLEEEAATGVSCFLLKLLNV